MSDENIVRNQIALFNLICGLAKEITGQMPNVTMQQKDGSTVICHPTKSSVTWYQVDLPASYPLQKELPKYPEHDGVSRAMTKVFRQSV